MTERDVEKFQQRMTALYSNPRFTNVRFTTYFGGVAICYYDRAEKQYHVERVVEPAKKRKKQEDTDNDS